MINLTFKKVSQNMTLLHTQFIKIETFIFFEIPQI